MSIHKQLRLHGKHRLQLATRNIRFEIRHVNFSMTYDKFTLSYSLASSMLKEDATVQQPLESVQG